MRMLELVEFRLNKIQLILATTPVYN